MLIFTSAYSMVDGFFVSNFVNKTAFAAVNIILPVVFGVGAIGFMMGTGGSALVAKTMGEGDMKKANEYFSMIVYVTLAAGVLFSILGHCLIYPIAGFLGATGEMLDYCVVYGRILFSATPVFVLQYMFQSFFAVASKTKTGLAITLAAGFSNIILDALFMVVFKWGIAGAAIATAVSQIVGGVVPLVYFFSKNSSTLRLVKTKIFLKPLLKACANGSSELMTNISVSLIQLLYNFQLMRLAGEDGVAAYGTLIYVSYIFISIFLGYGIGSAPLFAYNEGAGNTDELKSLFKKSMATISSLGVVLLVVSIVFAKPMSMLFVGYDQALTDMTVHAFWLYSFCFLFNGINIFGSAFFTALNNGLISAVISFLRTLVFQVVSVLVLPIFFGINGIWVAVAVAEMLSLTVTLTFFVVYRKKYRYA